MPKLSTRLRALRASIDLTDPGTFSSTWVPSATSAEIDTAPILFEQMAHANTWQAGRRLREVAAAGLSAHLCGPRAGLHASSRPAREPWRMRMPWDVKSIIGLLHPRTPQSYEGFRCWSYGLLAVRERADLPTLVFSSLLSFAAVRSASHGPCRHNAAPGLQEGAVDVQSLADLFALHAHCCQTMECILHATKSKGLLAASEMLFVTITCIEAQSVSTFQLRMSARYLATPSPCSAMAHPGCASGNRHCLASIHTQRAFSGFERGGIGCVSVSGAPQTASPSGFALNPQKRATLKKDRPIFLETGRKCRVASLA